MMSRIGFIKDRMRVNLRGLGSVASTVQVHWSEISGGAIDAGTGGNVGGVETFLSGALRAFGHEIPARSSLVKYTEIEMGDLILDMDGNPEVEMYPGQLLSGAQPLDSLKGKGLRYIWNGRWYTSKEVGPDLQAAWDAFVADQQLHRTLLLKREA